MGHLEQIDVPQHRFDVATDEINQAVVYDIPNGN
jgi:hypothetical protein